MKNNPSLPSLFIIIMFTLTLNLLGTTSRADEINLPRPILDGSVSVEKALATRTTARSYSSAPLTLAQVSQLLWSGNGLIPVDAVSSATLRVIPSARKTYPIELYLVCGDGTVQQLAAGVYHYRAERHALEKIMDGDVRKPMALACKGQSWIAKAPVSVIIGSAFQRAEATSGPERGVNFGVMEAGNANQNILLQARALGLESNTVGGIRDAELSSVLKLPADVRPVVLVTLGNKR
ncbi:MAG: SagB/ThcOx family dehydrogenase [Desulfomonilaceae bacterium]